MVRPAVSPASGPARRNQVTLGQLGLDGATVVGAISKDQRDAVKEQLLKTGELLTVDTPKLDEVAAA